MTEGRERLISRPVFYTLVATCLFGLLLYLLRGILAPVLLAFLLAYACHPLVSALNRRRVPRALASALCLLLLLLLTIGLVALIVPALQQEVQGLASRMPAYLEKVQQSAIPWIEDSFGIELPDTLSETLASARSQFGGRMQQIAGPLSSILKGMLSGTLSLLASLIYVILVPMFIFYFLRDYEKIMGWFSQLIPPRHSLRAAALFREIDQVLAGFLRGQMIIISVLAMVYSTVLSIIGVPAAITIGIIAGLFNIVPYLGTATGFLLSMLFLLLEGADWSKYFIVCTVFSVVSFSDAMFMTPKVLGKKMGLAPVMVILAILAFGEVFGFLGVLLAVPVTAVGKVVARHAIAAYKRSRLFGGDAAGYHSAGE